MFQRASSIGGAFAIFVFYVGYTRHRAAPGLHQAVALAMDAVSKSLSASRRAFRRSRAQAENSSNGWRNWLPFTVRVEPPSLSEIVRP
ncbi:MAG: hypothetical protein ACLUEQ_05630 [Cloacibacillus evryensis]